MIDVRINGMSLRDILTGAPVINDSVESACRSLEIQVKACDALTMYLGQVIELWNNGARWFVGTLRTESANEEDGTITYTAYDPLYFFLKNTDDFYFKNMTATQIFKTLATKSGVRVASLANTGAVFKALYYQGADADKVAIDAVARTRKANGKKFWYRYKPDYGSDGLILFENKVPAQVWAFQVGVNLIASSYEKSIEDAITVVKLINRDTGRVVKKYDTTAVKAWGQLIHFEEVDKDQAATMDKKAAEILAKECIVKDTRHVEGINPKSIMPQFFSGDVIYIESPRIKTLGGYYIRSVTQSFESDDLIKLTFDVQDAPDVPEIQYEDATKPPEGKAGKKAKADKDKGIQQVYSPEMEKLLKTYDLD